MYDDFIDETLDDILYNEQDRGANMSDECEDCKIDFSKLGNKYDSDKLRFDLIIPEFEEEIAKVLTMGAKKYAADSWRRVPEAKDRYYAALRRHISAWRKGEVLDTESGLQHLAHAACNIMFLMYIE